MRKLFVLFFLAMVIIACGVFEPRVPKGPSDDNAVLDLWHTFHTTPQLCLENLYNVYNYREFILRYADILTSDFTFYFDPQDVSDFSTPQSWQRSTETDMLLNVYQQSTHISLEMAPIDNQNDSIQSNNAWLYRDYNLYVGHNRPNLDNIFVGKMHIYMIREANGLWKIKDWYDFRYPANITMGRMKDAFAS